MRTSIHAQSFVMVVGIAVSAYAGDLNPPPGPIGPTMKRLDQVEPRTPISSLPYTITQGGSYYLTGNLTGVAGQNGITVIAGDVTIDLMGFTLYGVPGSLDGIGMGMLPIAISNVTVRNGTVRGWGGDGIVGTNEYKLSDLLISSNAGRGIVGVDRWEFHDVIISANGGNGATVGSYAHMEEVSFASNGGMGAQIGSYTHMEEVSFSYNGGGGAIVGSAAHMEEVSFCNNTGNGLEAGDTCIITKCTAEGNTLDGIVTGESVSMTDVVVSGNGGRGIVLTHHDKRGPAILSTVRANGNVGDGIVLGENATCTGCAAVDNLGRGIVADKSSPQLHKALAVGNGSDGIVLGENATCNDCTAQGNAGRGIVADKAIPKEQRALAIGNGGDGIVLGENGTCENCTASGNAGRGIVADKSSPMLFQCSAIGNTGGDGIVLGKGGSAENCTSRNNGGNGVTANMVQCRQIHSEGNSGDGIVVAPGSTLTDCQALNNIGNGLVVRDNNVPPKTSTVLLRDCVARGNGAIGFKMTRPPVTPPSADAAQIQTRDQGIATPAAPVAAMPLDVEKATAGASVRPARGPSLAMPLASVRFAGTGFGCVAEENLGDGFYLDGEWSLSQCVSRNNGGVGINSWSWGETQTSSAEGNASDGFVFHGGFRMTGCTSRNNGGVGINSWSWGETQSSSAVGNASDGFVFHGGFRMTGCTSRNNGGVGVNSWSFGEAQTASAEGNVSDGFVLRGGYILTECMSRGNGGVGIHVTDNNSPAKSHGCVAEGNGLDGFVVTSGALLTGCTAQGNGTTGVGSGIRVTGTGNRLEGNHLLSNFDWGLSLFGGGNLVIGNTAADNRIADYDIAAGNSYGPIVSAAAGNLSMASGGDQPTANFSLTCPTWCQDADTDTFGNPNSTTRSCTQPSGYATDCTDCDDTNAAINPGASEICNGLDDDCDQTIDEGCPQP